MNRFFRVTVCLVGVAVAGACGVDEPIVGEDILGAGGGAGGTPAGDAASRDAAVRDAANLRFGFEEVALHGKPDELIDFQFLPDGKQFLLLTKEGGLFQYELTGDSAQIVASAQVPDVYSPSDCGALSLAVDPNWNDNRFVFIGKCTSKARSGIYRYRFDPGAPTQFAGSEVKIIDAGTSSAARAWHNVGSIGFDPDGYLWALFGDKTVSNEAQNLESELGAVVRIIPSRDDAEGGYEPVDSNPFVGDADNSDAIWAWGVRSPWRGAVDGRGRLVFADVGRNKMEEVNVVSRPGLNFGWPQAEGPCKSDCDGLQDPVLGWNRSLEHPYVVDDEDATPVVGRAAWVGGYYRGSVDRYEARLTDRLLFGDACIGFVRALRLSDTDEVIEDVHLTHLDAPAAWREGGDGFLYVATFGTCQTDKENPNDGRSRFLRLVLR